MKNILIKDLKLKWKKVKNNECYVNTKKNKILRFIFAKKIIEVMKEGKIILNFDESVINLTTSRSHSWCERKSSTARSFCRRISGLSILVAVSSIGDIIF